MSAISTLSSSFSFRPNQGAILPSATRQTQPQAARGVTYGSSNTGIGAARGNSGAANASSAYCPTCAGNTSRADSSSYCPTCNRAGGTQSSVTNSAPFRGSAQTATTGSHAHQGGRICVGCAYQGR